MCFWVVKPRFFEARFKVFLGALLAVKADLIVQGSFPKA
jgi:hypothetical protein